MEQEDRMEVPMEWGSVSNTTETNQQEVENASLLDVVVDASMPETIDETQTSNLDANVTLMQSSDSFVRTPVTSISMPSTSTIIQNIVVSVGNNEIQTQQQNKQPAQSMMATEPSLQAPTASIMLPVSSSTSSGKNQTMEIFSPMSTATTSAGPSVILAAPTYLLPSSGFSNISMTPGQMKNLPSGGGSRVVGGKQQLQPTHASPTTAFLINASSLEQPGQGSQPPSAPTTSQQQAQTQAQASQPQPQVLILSPLKAVRFTPGTIIRMPQASTSPSKRAIAPAPPKMTMRPPTLGSSPNRPQSQQSLTTILTGTQAQAGGKSNVQFINSIIRPGNIKNANTTLVGPHTKLVPIKPLPAPSNVSAVTSMPATTVIVSKPLGIAGQSKTNVVQFNNKQLLINQKTFGTASPSRKMVIGGGGQTLQTSGAGTSGQPIWMMKSSGQVLKASSKVVLTSGGDTPKYVPIAPNPGPQGTLTVVSSSGDHSHGGIIPKIKVLEPRPIAGSSLSTDSQDSCQENRRRPCNCTRSQCLKLYCECFANGEFCQNCNCVSCYNNLENEDRRKRAIRMCLERNPNAFHPKIGQTPLAGEVDRMHTKGCHCKRSGCLKNYCECYEAKILCSERCRCIACKNYEDSAERKMLDGLVKMDLEKFPASIKAGSVGTPLPVKFPSMWENDVKMKLPIKVKADCPPFYCLTPELLETTASCLMAVAEEGEYEEMETDAVQELILKEFGECLSQILNSAYTTEEDKN